MNIKEELAKQLAAHVREMKAKEFRAGYKAAIRELRTTVWLVAPQPGMAEHLEKQENKAYGEHIRAEQERRASPAQAAAGA